MNEILALLGSSNVAVERAILALIKHNALTTSYDVKGATYWVTWIESGKHLSGDHLVKARIFCVRYASALLAIANAKNTETVLPQAKSLVLDRAGEFRIKVSGNSHCGVGDNILVHYSTKIECVAKLDSRGFLVDQLNVHSFFEAIKATRLSCEQLVMTAAQGLRSMVKAENRNVEIKALSLTLSPQPFAAAMTVNLLFPMGRGYLYVVMTW